MTCLVWDGESVAGDKATFMGSVMISTTKIHIVEGHAGKLILALCGYSYFTERALAHFRSPIAEPTDWYKKVKDIEPEASYGFAIDMYGRCLPIYGDCSLGRPCEAWYVDGAGMQFLAGAMAAGATARRAIELAVKLTTHAGFGVDEIKFEDVFGYSAYNAPKPNETPL